MGQQISGCQGSGWRWGKEVGMAIKGQQEEFLQLKCLYLDYINVSNLVVCTIAREDTTIWGN